MELERESAAKERFNCFPVNYPPTDPIYESKRTKLLH